MVTMPVPRSADILEFNSNVAPGDGPRFTQWRRENDDGYYVNIVTAKTGKLHRSGCHHAGWNDETDAAAKAKLCSLDRDGLLRWAVENGAAVSPCATCKTKIEFLGVEEGNSETGGVTRGLEETRRKVLREIAERQGQGESRASLLVAYGERCAVTGTSCAQVLDAAHIVPYAEMGENSVANGLLLRSDIHVLFDLNLLAIDAAYKLVVSPHLSAHSDYSSLNGSAIRLPAKKRDWPEQAHLQGHRERLRR
jgi:hypothetical protein